MSLRVFMEYAHKYSTLGWAVFPLAQGQKVPMKGTDGFKSASAFEAQIAAWGTLHPCANIGIATGKASGIIVIDMDPRSGSGATVVRLARQGKIFNETVEATSPREGRHLYYAYDTGVTISKANALGPGIDLKTDGGYVVAPPSIWRGNGKRYAWVRPPRGANLPPLPQWVIEALRPKPVHKSQAVTLPSPADAEGYRAQALADLRGLQVRMASLTDGRHAAPFEMACTIGKYVAAGCLAGDEVERAFLAASAANGALNKYSAKDLVMQVRNGLRRAGKDSLPPLAHVHRKAALNSVDTRLSNRSVEDGGA
jgi:Bifunctional DNA primase/polymerase, N-terminal